MPNEPVQEVTTAENIGAGAAAGAAIGSVTGLAIAVNSVLAPVIGAVVGLIGGVLIAWLTGDSRKSTLATGEERPDQPETSEYKEQ